MSNQKLAIVELLYRDMANFKSHFHVLNVPIEEAPQVGDRITLDEPYHGLTEKHVWRKHHMQYGEELGKNSDLDHNELEVVNVTTL